MLIDKKYGMISNGRLNESRYQSLETNLQGAYALSPSTIQIPLDEEHGIIGNRHLNESLDQTPGTNVKKEVSQQ